MLIEIEELTLSQAFEDAFNKEVEVETTVETPERYEVTIAVWPDGYWCYTDEAYLQLDKSDDYTILRPSIINEEDIEEAIQQWLQS